MGQEVSSICSESGGHASVSSLYRHVRTLVLDLDDTLVHSDWTRGRGWRTFKRPGAEDFIRTMAQYYELVHTAVLLLAIWACLHPGHALPQ